jgi:hypothetical protein
LKVLSKDALQGEQSLRIAVSFTYQGLDPDEPFLIFSMIGKQIIIEVFIDTGATGGNFIDIKIAQRICETEQIEPLRLLRPKIVQRYDGKENCAKITHAIYSRLQI